jgi:hypothetical protein
MKADQMYDARSYIKWVLVIFFVLEVFINTYFVLNPIPVERFVEFQYDSTEKVLHGRIVNTVRWGTARAGYSTADVRLINLFGTTVLGHDKDGLNKILLEFINNIAPHAHKAWCDKCMKVHLYKVQERFPEDTQKSLDKLIFYMEAYLVRVRLDSMFGRRKSHYAEYIGKEFLEEYTFFRSLLNKDFKASRKPSEVLARYFKNRVQGYGIDRLVLHRLSILRNSKASAKAAVFDRGLMQLLPYLDKAFLFACIILMFWPSMVRIVEFIQPKHPEAKHINTSGIKPKQKVDRTEVVIPEESTEDRLRDEQQAYEALRSHYIGDEVARQVIALAEKHYGVGLGAPGKQRKAIKHATYFLEHALESDPDTHVQVDEQGSVIILKWT